MKTAAALPERWISVVRHTATDSLDDRGLTEAPLEQPKIEAGIGYYLGLIYCLLGEKEQAVSWFEKAYEEQLGILVILGGEPIFDPLRSEPRFQALLRKLDVVE
jgi:hypothetical protein